MSRRLVIILAILAAGVFGAVYFWPEKAEAGGVSARLHMGDGGVGLNGAFGGVRFSDGLHDHSDKGRGHRDHGHRDDADRHRHHGHQGVWGHWPRSVVLFPSETTERVIVRETVVVPQPTVPPPPASMAVTPPPPLDPQGMARTVSARGGERPREWVLGAVLPPDLAYVVLDPSSYGLAPPPDGEFYARVDGDVLRIEAGTRRILSVLAQ